MNYWVKCHVNRRRMHFLSKFFKQVERVKGACTQIFSVKSIFTKKFFVKMISRKNNTIWGSFNSKTQILGPQSITKLRQWKETSVHYPRRRRKRKKSLTIDSIRGSILKNGSSFLNTKIIEWNVNLIGSRRLYRFLF